MKPVKIDTTAIPKVEVKLLCSTFLEAIRAFYEVESLKSTASLYIVLIANIYSSTFFKELSAKNAFALRFALSISLN